MKIFKVGIQFILFFFLTMSLFSQDIIEFRGIGRTGHYSETGLLKEWPETGPEFVLKIEGIGKGYSQPVVADDKIFVTGIKKDTNDVLSAYNFESDLLWETPYGRSWTRSYTDSRSTPTYQNGKLYVSSGTGEVNCIDSRSGRVLWQVNAIKKYGGDIFRHGDAECPLIVDDIVVFTTGGEKNTMVALNKYDGSIVWKTKSLGAAKSYASPVLINHKGQSLILVQTSENLIAIDPASGNIFWNYDLIQFHEISQGRGAQTNPALYFNNDVFVTSGYDHPATMFSIAENNRSVKLKWKNEILDTHHGGTVLVDGNIYGSNWQHNARGQWASVNWDTGKTNWETEWINKGSIIYADGMLYLYEEKSGNVALVEPSPESMKIISTFQMTEGEGPHWAHPAIYNKKLFIRHGNVLMVYNLEA